MVLLVLSLMSLLSDLPDRESDFASCWSSTIVSLVNNAVNRSFCFLELILGDANGDTLSELIGDTIGDTLGVGY